jgi:hypothetical protein
MPSPRQRPLTWLYFIAANCVAVAAGARDSNSFVTSVLITAEAFLIAGWAAVGQSHRLLRGALLCIAPIGAAVATLAQATSASEVRAVLAFMLLACGIAFAAAWITGALVRSLQRARDGVSRWRISIMELLGWMVVVAIGSAAARQAKLPPLEHIHALEATLASAAVAGALVALFLTPGVKHDRLGLVIAALLVTAFFTTVWLAQEFDKEDCFLTGTLFGVVGLGVLVMRLDEHAARELTPSASEEAAAQPLRLHAEPSRDE